MKLIYSQTHGTISNESGEVIATGWADNHAGKNNANMQDKPSLGPLPRGLYTICPWEAVHDHLGPMVAFLKPYPTNEMFGRGDFFMHGPARGTKYGQESKGCVVVPRVGRQKVKDTGATILEVVL